jgi:hypothetical protein
VFLVRLKGSAGKTAILKDGEVIACGVAPDFSAGRAGGNDLASALFHFLQFGYIQFHGRMVSFLFWMRVHAAFALSSARKVKVVQDSVNLWPWFLR